MSRIHNETMQKKLASIKTGARLFSLVGRIVVGAGLLTAAWVIVGQQFVPLGFDHSGTHLHWNIDLTGERAFQPIFTVVFGWLFTMVGDAFAAIEALIQEMGEIV